MTNHPDTFIYCHWFDKTKRIENIPQPSYVVVDVPHLFSDTMPTVYIQVEPDIICNVEQYLIDNHHRYHTIITFNQNVLNTCPNSKSYLYGTTWIERAYYDKIDTTKKQFKISHLAGTKLMNNAEGHKMRQNIHHNQQVLNDFPITFFRSSQQPHIHDYGNNPLLGLGNSDTTPHNKLPLFEEFQFAIVIENSKQTNYFTEKIMDCVLTKTIPIYWGCPNINDYFDTTGWILLDTSDLKELAEKLKALDSTYYHTYKDIIDNNHKKAQEYTDLYKNINNAKRIM